MWPFKEPTWPDIPLEEIKKRARLLVIDDSDFPYKELFVRDGYTLEQWPDVNDLSKLESGYFDILLLDLQGVGREQSREQGLGVLRHLRQTSPAQLIIAFSSADWPLKYQEFFQLADAVLSKTSDYVDFKRRVDELLIQRFSLGFYVGRIQAAVGEGVNDKNRLQRAVRDSILTNDPAKIRKVLEGKVSIQTINTVLSIVQVGISLIKIWTTPA